MARRPTEVDRLTILEHTVISQNASVNDKLGNIERGMRELHDKMDNYILNHSIEMAGLKAKTEEHAKRIIAIDRKAGIASTAFMGLLVAVVGGMLSFFISGK